MAIAIKRAPVTSVEGMDRVIQKIYDDLNEVINAVNQSTKEVRSTTTGKKGDIRVVKDSTDGTFKIEAYTEDGWAYTSNLTLSFTKE